MTSHDSDAAQDTLPLERAPEKCRGGRLPAIVRGLHTVEGGMSRKMEHGFLGQNSGLIMEGTGCCAQGHDFRIRVNSGIIITWEAVNCACLCYEITVDTI